MPAVFFSLTAWSLTGSFAVEGGLVEDFAIGLTKSRSNLLLDEEELAVLLAAESRLI